MNINNSKNKYLYIYNIYIYFVRKYVNIAELALSDIFLIKENREIVTAFLGREILLI